MSTAATFTPRLLGQTEKALNAFLDRELAASGLTEHQWIALALAVTDGGEDDRARLVGRVAGALKVAESEAGARVDELGAAGLLEAGGAGSKLVVTEAGRQLHARVRAATGEVARRLWGDLASEDLEAAGRVLSTILERADAELAGA